MQLLIPRKNKNNCYKFCVALKIVRGQIQPCVDDISVLHGSIDVKNLARILH